MKINGSLPKHTKASLEKGIAQYLEDCVNKTVIPNKAGLRLHLDISRDTYSEYRKKHPDAIRVADTAIESAWVQRLTSTGATGAIFYLKNAFREDYSDRTETDITTGGEKITSTDDIKALSDKFDDFFKRENG